MMSSQTTVYSIVAKVLGLPVSDVHENLIPKNVQNWDSLRHMTILMAVEEAFDLTFSDKEMISVGSVGDLVSLVDSKSVR